MKKSTIKRNNAIRKRYEEIRADNRMLLMKDAVVILRQELREKDIYLEKESIRQIIQQGGGYNPNK